MAPLQRKSRPASTGFVASVGTWCVLLAVLPCVLVRGVVWCRSDANSVQKCLKTARSAQFACLIASADSSFSSVRGTGDKCFRSVRSVHPVQFTNSSGPDGHTRRPPDGGPTPYRQGPTSCRASRRCRHRPCWTAPVDALKAHRDSCIR